MMHSSIDIIIDSQIYWYRVDNIDISSYNLNVEDILYYDNENLILHNIILQSNDYIDEYDNFIRIGKIIILSKKDIISLKNAVVGLSQRDIEFHKNYFISFILKILELIQDGNIQQAIDCIRKTYKSYVNRELDVGFYREFNLQSKFKISSSSYIYAFDLPPNNPEDIDINYNEKVLRYLFNLLWGLYGKT